MTQVRRLDNQHDMTFGHGAANYAQDAESVAQRVMCRLLSIEANWFLDTGHGLPYLQQIMIKPANLFLVESLIRRCIRETEGVSELLSFNLVYDLQTRKVTIDSSVRTAFGTTKNIQASIT